MIVTSDGTYIYSYDTLADWLQDKGIDDFNLEEFMDMCQDPTIKDDAEWYKREYDNLERAVDGYYCNLRDMANDIDDLADKLASGKGGTKANYAERFKDIVRFYRG